MNKHLRPPLVRSEMNSMRRFLNPALVLLCFTIRVFGGGVVINEVMYHPSSENLLESYVELYNSGTTPVMLSGWKFTKGIQFGFPTNTSISPGAYLVVAADRAAFVSKYPAVTNFVAGWLAPMSSHLLLADGAGQVISEVDYSNDGDWAARTLTQWRTELVWTCGLGMVRAA